MFIQLSRNSQVPLYQKIWSKMNAHHDEVMTDSNAEGIVIIIAIIIIIIIIIIIVIIIVIIIIIIIIEVMTNSNTEGMDKVLSGHGRYAYIMETASIDYMTAR